MIPSLPRPLILASLLTGGLMLSACEEDLAAPEAMVATAPSLAGVDLTQPVRVLGTEPFWHLDITSAALTFTGVDQPEVRADHTGPTLQGSTAQWSSQTPSGLVFKISLTASDCSDGMSDRIYPLTAQVTVGETAYTGCAAQLKAIEKAGESGRVE